MIPRKSAHAVNVLPLHSSPVPQLSSAELFNGAGEVIIEHSGGVYVLRQEPDGSLSLTELLEVPERLPVGRLR